MLKYSATLPTPVHTYWEQFEPQERPLYRVAGSIDEITVYSEAEGDLTQYVFSGPAGEQFERGVEAALEQSVELYTEALYSLMRNYGCHVDVVEA